MEKFTVKQLESRLSVLKSSYDSLLPTLKALQLNPQYDDGSNAREKARLEREIATVEKLISEKKAEA